MGLWFQSYRINNKTMNKGLQALYYLTGEDNDL